jgi:hypothetical protein
LSIMNLFDSRISALDRRVSWSLNMRISRPLSAHVEPPLTPTAARVTHASAGVLMLHATAQAPTQDEPRSQDLRELHPPPLLNASLPRCTPISDRLRGNPALAHRKPDPCPGSVATSLGQARVPAQLRGSGSYASPWLATAVRCFTAYPCLRGQETPTRGVWLSKAPKCKTRLPSTAPLICQPGRGLIKRGKADHNGPAQAESAPTPRAFLFCVGYAQGDASSGQIFRERRG